LAYASERWKKQIQFRCDKREERREAKEVYYMRMEACRWLWNKERDDKGAFWRREGMNRRSMGGERG
jgi:hypothetical protein